MQSVYEDYEDAALAEDFEETQTDGTLEDGEIIVNPEGLSDSEIKRRYGAKTDRQKKFVEETKAKNGVYDDTFYNRLLTVKKEDASWELFDEVYESKTDRERGYWACATIVCLLLHRQIQYNFNDKNAGGNRGQEREYYEDYKEEVLLDIQKNLYKYEKEKSPNFTCFIKNYLVHVAYVFANDSTVYMSAKKGYRIFFIDELLNKDKDDDEKGGSGDAYLEDVDQRVEYAVEDDVRQRNSMIFASHILRSDNDYDIIKKAKDDTINRYNNHIAMINSNYNEGSIPLAEKNGAFEEAKKKMLSDIKRFEVADEKEETSLFVKGAFFSKFLGGRNCWPREMVKAVENDAEIDEEMEAI